jgi:hypothetical protein
LGYSSGYSTLLLSDSTSAPTGGNFKLRVASVAQGASGVDIYVDPVGADINAATARVTQLFSRTVGDFQNIAAGDVQIRATVTGSKDIVFDSGRISMAQGQTFTLYLYTSGSARLLQGALVPQDNAQSPTFYRGTVARARLVHAAATLPNLNATVTPGSTISGVAPGAASAHSTFTNGAKTVRIEGTATPGAALATGNFTFAPATDYSLVAVDGAAGSGNLLAFTESTVAPQGTRTRARFVNLTSDLASIDVFFGTTRVAASVARQGASGYGDFDASTFTLGVNAAGASTGATLPSVTLAGDGVYTIYVRGTAANLSSVLIKEN